MVSQTLETASHPRVFSVVIAEPIGVKTLPACPANCSAALPFHQQHSLILLPVQPLLLVLSHPGKTKLLEGLLVPLSTWKPLKDPMGLP